MALSAQNSRSHSYTRVPKHDDFVEAPYYPFVSEAVRMDAIEHLWTYQELALPYSEEDLGVPLVLMSDTSNLEVDRLIRRRVVQGMIIHDLNQILERIPALERSLQSKRKTAWFTQILLAAGTHVILQNHYINQLLTRSFNYIPPLHFLVGYPFAVWKLWIFEWSIISTRRVREGLERLRRLVKIGRQVYDSDMECLEGAVWNRVPWVDEDLD